MGCDRRIDPRRAANGYGVSILPEVIGGEANASPRTVAYTPMAQSYRR